MAKLAKSKRKAPSIHSRAARRAVSPTIKTPRHLRDLSPQPKQPTKFSTGGIIKRRKKVQLSHSQKQRAQKALERADVMADRLERKVSRSEGKSKTVKERKKDWIEVNSIKKIGILKAQRNGFEVLGEMNGEDENKSTTPNLAQKPKYGDGNVPLDPEGPTILAMRTAEKSIISPKPEPTLQSLDDMPDI